MHVRTQLRNQVANALQVMQTPYTLTIVKNRGYPLDESMLPCLHVQTGAESVDTLTIDYPAQQMRTEQLIISVIAEANSAVDDLIDDLCAYIEKQLAGGFNPLVKSFTYVGMTAIEPNVAGEKPVCSVDLRYTAEIHTLENNPEAYL